MSAISQKSITGITSITTPAGVDNQLTLHVNDTSEALKLDHAGNIHIHNHVNTTGISSASNFKTGSSNLHSSGLSAASIDVGSNIKLGNAGIITATSYVGGLPITDGANNRIITASSASAIQGEAGLTFDGTTLSNVGTGFKEIKIAPSTNNSATLRLQNSQANFTVSNITGGSFSIADGSDTRFTINSSGVVGINNDLDVDGHTNLDNVSVAGVTTFSGIIDAINTPASIRVAQDIQHKGDADTKISFPANDTITAETGGTERLRIDSNGDLITKGQYIKIENVASPEIQLTDTSASNSLCFIRNSSGNLRISADNNNVRTGTSLMFLVDGSEEMRIKDSKVGIGTDNPSQPLDVRGNSLSDKFTARSAATSTYTTSTTGYKFGARGSYALSVGGNRSSNGSSFTMFELRDFNNSKYFDIEISFCHAGGGIHGSYRRFAGICNGYTSITTWEDTGNKNTGGGLGFSISKPDNHTLRVVWNGANSYADNYTLYCLIHASYDGTYFSYIDSAFY